MNSPVQTYPLPARFSRWLLGCAIRHWPEDTKAWGTALAAEIDETKNELESLLWLWGGIMLFARSVVSSILAWLKLPAGSGAGGNDGSPSNLPRRSRLLTAVVLIAAAALFLSPEGRDAIAMVRASWGDLFHQSPSDRRVLETMAARAEKENDATMLAFAAVSVEDRQDATAWADQAVSLNPNFVWIYGLSRSLPSSRDQRLKRLHSADPGNAFPLILAASSTAEQSGTFTDHLTPTEIKTRLSDNPKWMALMAQALASPRYDGYEQRRLELVRSIWARERNLSPTILFQGTIGSYGNPLGSLFMFGDICGHRAENAGNLKEVERLLDEENALGERMVNDQKSTTLEKAIALDLVDSANHGLAQVYSKTGETAGVKQAMSRIQKVNARRNGLWPPDRLARLDSIRRGGILVQCFGIFAILAGLTSLAGILLLELWPFNLQNRGKLRRKVVCRIADHGPVAALIAGTASLVSFVPFARAFSEYRSSAAAISSPEIFVQTIWYFGFSHDYGWQGLRNVWLWSLFTVVLAAFAVYIVVRSIHRAQAVAIALTIAAVGFLGTSCLKAQEVAKARPSFAVASIKPDKSGSSELGHHVYFPNRFTATITTRQLIEYAYGDDASHGNGLGLNDDQVAGGPDWVASEVFEIDAQGDSAAAASDEQWMERVRPLARSLLSERFNLKIRHEMRDLPAYALVASKHGPKLTEDRADASQGGVRATGTGRFKFTASGLDNLAWVLSMPNTAPGLARRPVLDQTGLDGRYDFEFQPPAAQNSALPPPSAASISSALEAQLGLRLEPATMPMDTIVIEHIERPTGR